MSTLAWTIPASLTAFAFIAATILAWRDGVGGWGYIGHHVALGFYLAATIISCASWLGFWVLA